jgi:capsular exopolysaccharide synthesis family protein
MSNSLQRSDRFDDERPTKARSTQELVEYLWVIRRGWKVIVAVCALTVGAAWYSMSGQIPSYTASAMLQFTGGGGAGVLGAGARYYGIPVDYASEVEIIRSRTVLDGPVDSLNFQLNLGLRAGDRSELIRGIDLDPLEGTGSWLLTATETGSALLDPATEEVVARAARGAWLSVPGFRLLVDEEEIGEEPVPISVGNFESAVSRLRGSLLVEPGLGPELIHITYSDPDAEYAAAVTNAVAEAYADYRAEADRDEARTTREFLAGRLEEMADSLQRVQQHLQEYQQSQGSLDPRMEGNTLMGNLYQEENSLRMLQYQEGLLEDLVRDLGSGANVGPSRLVGLGDILPGGIALYSELQRLNNERAALVASPLPQPSRLATTDSLIAATWRDVRELANGGLSMRRTEIAAVQGRVNQLQGSVGAMPERSAEFTRLGQQVETVQAVFDELMSSYYQAQIAEAIETGDVRIVDPATVPMYPEGTSFGLNIGIALIVGLLFGAGGVVVRHHFDTRIKGADEAERSADLQTLGMIPRFSGTKALGNGAGIEAFRVLATSLHFLDANRSMVIAVASAAPGEGKTTVAVNLAISSASAGRRVLLIDADLRRPVINNLLKVPRNPGLSDVLRGTVPAVAAIRNVESWGLDVMTCGSAVADPVSSFARNSYADLLDRLRSHYDLVIVDTAPVLAVAEALIACTAADGVLFAVRAHQTDQRAVAEATAKIRQVNGNLIGLVLTDVPTGSSYSRSYRYYDYGYYGQSGDSKSQQAKAQSRLLSGIRGRV